MDGYNFSMKPVSVPQVVTRFRKIGTPIPVPESIPLFEEVSKYESRSMHGQLPIVWDRAEDFQVYDPYGNCWIDFTSTIFVTNCGHSNPAIVSALRDALDRKLLHTYTFVNESRIKFLRKLIGMTSPPFEKAFLLSAGTEATEAAVKLMRMHGQKQSDSRVGIISFRGSMHGRTMCAEMLKGDPASSMWIGYHDPNIYHLPFPYPWETPPENNWYSRFEEDMGFLIRNGLNIKSIAGFMIESYIGWGAIFFPKEYIKALVSFARKHGILVAFDDIQGGFGRTGKLFAYEHYDVEPDLLCAGKGISSSLPLSAVLGRKTVMDLPGVGEMSSTHSANPLSCAAGLANLESIEGLNLVKESERKGKILHKRLGTLKERYPRRISYTFGKGLLAAVLIVDPEKGDPDALFSSRVVERAMQKGLLLVHTGRESIKIGPPLTIPDEALLEGLDVLEESVKEVDKGKV